MLTVDAADTIIRDGAVAVRGCRIVGVGETTALRKRFVARETIDARGGVVHPGFIDAHIHVSQYTARSVLPRMAGTSITMGDWKGALRPEDEHASAALAAIDYLAGGTTGFVDPGTIFEPDAVAAVASETGIRIWLTDPYVADRGHALKEHLAELVSPTFLARWPRDLDDALSRVGSQLHRNRSSDGLVHAFIGLYGEATGSDALFAAALATARRSGVQLQQHLGYSPASFLTQERELGRPLLADYIDRHGIDRAVSFIHMNVVTRDDVLRLASAQVRVVWCPYGQLQMLAQPGAQCRQGELANAGVVLGLATDIPRVIDVGAIGSLAMAAGAALGTPLSPRLMMRMRTIGGAATVGATADVGSLEVGKRADIVLRRPAASEALGQDVSLETAALGTRAGVHLVVVNGAVVVRDGACGRVVSHDIVDRAHASVRSIATRIGLA
ncbi:MAG: amidohydrolase family protein [Alphaproteobacteria bacterium]|nr:amidohydrolase family protein [Alphaproteobacteria bacterium]